MRLVLRGLGWTCVAAGAILALYLVYSLYWTGVETAAAQDELRERWEAEVGPVAAATPDEFSLDVDAVDGTIASQIGSQQPAAEVAPTVPEGDALAALQLARDGAPAPVLAEPVMVVEGVTDEALQRGPGHYTGTALPGQPGNFAIAGHRTTYGAPFYDLDRVLSGDELHVTDRSGTRWVYEVVETRVVGPLAVEVLSQDPLGNGKPVLTLTTCHPRFSNAQRLIVFAELVAQPAPSSG